MTISIQKKRDEIKREALRIVLDEDKEPEHLWEALLISNLDNVIDSIESIDIDGLAMTIEDASKSTNNLTRKIKTLTWVLVVISIIGLGIASYTAFL